MTTPPTTPPIPPDTTTTTDTGADTGISTRAGGLPPTSRFAAAPSDLPADQAAELDALVGRLPAGWSLVRPDGTDPAVVAALTSLLREHEEHGRGWPGADESVVAAEVGPDAERTRANVVLLDPDGAVRAWGSVHDRAGGRMLFVHVVARDLVTEVADAASAVLITWAVAQAVTVGRARGIAVQQIDTGAFAADDRQHAWLGGSGFALARTWWQMGRAAHASDVDLVPDPASWERRGVRFRLVRREGDGMPHAGDLRDVHAVLEGAFADHFNSWEESFDEFLHRLREDPGHRWDHWWLAELLDDDATDGHAAPRPVGALVATVSGSGPSPDGSYVSYLGVLEAARGRGVAKGLLHSVVADAVARGRDRVALEVDADSPTGAHGLYRSLGWETRYTTQSWHRDVAVS
ncbi:GNAT family N-acetyltransferase [Litorihabitans aurantiacus]|uniref:N-acetyltransferase n=1 Tax=Litorihabitans aurantiacus TaxID=1930061 RepID=A0AA37UI40_9MICO|nr:GNAT family N-acetyltransferase [Litorihabitans aurantiacus]GMA31278.1 N-acetyltransferase [Litorihabitans aurantiacus]